MYRSFRYKLRPTAVQADRLGQWVGAARLVYNLCLDQRRDFWRQHAANTGHHISFAGQSREVSELRVQHDFIADVPRSALTNALKDLDRAFRSFFSGRSGHPSPRRLGINDSVQFEGREIRVDRLNAKWANVIIPKIGPVRTRFTRLVDGKVIAATVRRVAGEWWVILKADLGEAPEAIGGPALGIDRGVATTLSFSTGEHFRLPDMTHLEKRRRRAQRVLARRTRGSKRRDSQRRRAARSAAKIARIRHHHLHVATARIARVFSVVALENLNIRGMTQSASGTVVLPGSGVAQKRGLNRSILAQGWGTFERLLAYKLEAAGGRLEYVPAAYTSQTCAECGVVDQKSRKKQASFECVACGHLDHADTNAARNILRGSTAFVEERHGCSVEAKTPTARPSEPARAGDAEPNTVRRVFTPSTASATPSP